MQPDEVVHSWCKKGKSWHSLHCGFVSAWWSIHAWFVPNRYVQEVFYRLGVFWWAGWMRNSILRLFFNGSWRGVVCFVSCAATTSPGVLRLEFLLHWLSLEIHSMLHSKSFELHLACSSVCCLTLSDWHVNDSVALCQLDAAIAIGDSQSAFVQGSSLGSLKRLTHFLLF